MLLEQILLHVPCPIFWKSLDGTFLGCNQAFLKLLNIQSYNDLIGRKDPDLPWRERTEQYIKDDQHVISTGETLNVVEDIPIEGNRTIISQTTKSPLIQDGKIIGVLGIALDITAQKEAEKLRLKEIVNKEKMETMRLMAATMAHEIRTPLATISAQSGVLKRWLPTLLSAYQYALEMKHVTPLSSTQLEALGSLPEELNKTTVSANNFIDMLLAKVNFEGMQHDHKSFKKISMQDAIIDALKIYPLDQLATDMIHCDYLNNFEFNGDETLFRHIIFNLLKNAIFFVRSKPNGGKIYIWCEQQAHQNILHFKDTGIGIKPSILPHIFNSFYTRSHQGTGVGLAFCKMTMASFGGNIRCESLEGQYTHFMLEFPKL